MSSKEKKATKLRDASVPDLSDESLLAEVRRRQLAKAEAAIAAYREEERLLQEKHGVGVGARPVITQQGTIGAEVVYGIREQPQNG